MLCVRVRAMGRDMALTGGSEGRWKRDVGVGNGGGRAPKMNLRAGE